MPGPMGGHGGGPGRHHGPMGGHGGGPGGFHGPMGGPPPPRHHRWGGYWGPRRPYRSGCLGGFLALILGCGGLFSLVLFAFSFLF